MMKVDIAILTIREDEFKAVRERFETTRRRIAGGRTYLIGEAKTPNEQRYTIAIARCSAQGNDASQKLANYIIHNLDPQLILIVGIAGGVPHDEFTLGDVVISTHIVNTNVDALNADGTTDYMTRGGPPHPLIEDIVSLLPGEPLLKGWNELASIRLERPGIDPRLGTIKGDDEWREKVRESLDWHFGEEQNRLRLPTFTMGSIISSNHLMKNPSVLMNLLKTNRSVLAVEMEAAGVYEAAQGIHHQYPVMAIRGVSDIVGLQRDRRWTTYACQTAAAFMYAFIMTAPIDPRMDMVEPRSFTIVSKSPFDSLPRPETFVGRREDLKWLLGRLCTGGVTSITALGGMGGIGKTRLAAEAIHELRKDGYFRDGIVVMRCGGRTDANKVVQSTLARFDPQGRPPETNDLSELIDAAHRLLDGKDALVVLDNVEPELDIINVVTPLSATSTTLLLTARQVLPYTIVSEEGNRCLDLLSSEEAMELFAQPFGQQVSWTPDTPEYVTVKRIITTLGRHTLAVKLAGAYAAVVKRDLGELAKDLEDPQQAIDLRDGETPEGLARIFVQSTESLPGDSRQLFEALATFATTSFGRQATLALGTALGLAKPAAAIDELVLRRLVDASINESMLEQSDRERRSLHPLTYAFVTRKFGLWPQDRQDTAHRALASFYATYADHLTKVSERALGVDEENIHRELEWVYNHRQKDLVVQLCMGMQYFWRNGGRRTASLKYLPWGIEAAEEVAKVVQKREGRTSEATLVYTYGQILFQMSRPNDAAEYYMKSLAIRQELGDRKQEGVVLAALGRLSLSMGRMEDANRYCLQALAIHREIKDRKEEGVDLSSLGQVALRCRKFQKAEEYCQQALAIRRLEGDQRGERIDFLSLGEIALERQQFEQAADYFRQALILSREGKEADRRGEAASLRCLGQVSLALGQLKDAEDYLQEALLMHREMLDSEGEGETLFVLANLAKAQNDMDRAEKLYRESLALFYPGQLVRHIADLLLTLGQFLVEQRSNREEGCSKLLEAQRYYAQMGIHTAEMDLPSEQRAREIAQQLDCYK